VESDTSHIPIDHTLLIPRHELTYRATRASGPGGQHVNTSSTRVELTWNAATSPALSEEQRVRILTKLAGRIDGEGVLRLTCGTHRSQARNRDDVTERFRSLLAVALRVPKHRRRTRPSRASKEARIQEKKKRGEVKAARRRVDPAE
jgi:ribosome-associated protein